MRVYMRVCVYACICVHCAEILDSDHCIHTLLKHVTSLGRDMREPKEEGGGTAREGKGERGEGGRQRQRVFYLLEVTQSYIRVSKCCP